MQLAHIIPAAAPPSQRFSAVVFLRPLTAALFPSSKMKPNTGIVRQPATICDQYLAKEASCCSKVARTEGAIFHPASRCHGPYQLRKKARHLASRVVNTSFGLTYNMLVALRYLWLALLCVGLTGAALAQDAPPPVERLPTDKSAPPPKDNTRNPPRSDNVPAGESSSKQTQIDVSPPSNDTKSHPEAGLGDSEESDVNEFTPYNPMKALKAVEVGDWYYKQENYKAAISRYREALEYKPHDAEATFKLAEVLNKTGDTAGAKENFEAYLKILPNGPYAKKSREALSKLKDTAKK